MDRLVDRSNDRQINSYRFANPAEALRGFEVSRLRGLIIEFMLLRRLARLREGGRAEEERVEG